MFGKSREVVPVTAIPTPVVNSENKISSAKIDTEIAKDTMIEGDIHFIGGLKIEGTIKGNLIGKGEAAFLVLEETGIIKGEIRIPRMILNGQVEGDVFAAKQLELYKHARVRGDVYYDLLDMKVGAEVNGKLVRQKENNEVSHIELPSPKNEANDDAT